MRADGVGGEAQAVAESFRNLLLRSGRSLVIVHGMSRPLPPDFPLSTEESRRVSALAQVDPKTLKTYLAGTRATYPRTAAAIARALRRIGRPELIKGATTTAAA